MRHTVNRGQCHHHILKRLMDQTVSYLLFSKAPPVVWFVTGPILTWNVLSLTRTGGTLPTGPRAVGIEGAGGQSQPLLILARIEAKHSSSKCLGLVLAPSTIFLDLASKCPGPPYRQASGPLEPGGILSLKIFAEIEAKPSPFYFFVPPKICWHSTGPVLPTGSFLQQESLNVSSDKEERRRFKVCHDFAAS